MNEQPRSQEHQETIHCVRLDVAITRKTGRRLTALGGHDLSRSGWWSLSCRLGFHFFESEASAVDVDDVAVVKESVEDGCGEDFVAG